MPSLFDTLPFTEAIDALQKRGVVSKSAFEQWSARNKSRAFTMAWISDLQMLEQIHDELAVAMADGESYAGFAKRLRDLGDRAGFTGTAPWHHRLVYEQNLGMAYTAGRMEQGVGNGFRVWRYLPSLSDHPRTDHSAYDGRLFRFEPGTVLPPWDYNCKCGWEWVFPEEYDSLGIDPAALPTFNPPRPASGYEWSPSAYADLQIEPSSYSGAVATLAAGLAGGKTN